MKKTFIACIFIFLFIFTSKVYASDYEVYKSYYDGDVLVSSYKTYNEALTKMKEIKSDTTCVAVLKYNNVILNANYAFVETNKWQIDHNDYEDNLNLFQDPSFGSSNGNAYTYVNGGWGVDSAFIDYNPTYRMVKLKISGFTGWARIGSVSIKPISKYFKPYLVSNITIGANIRSEANTTSEIVKTIFPGIKYTFLPSKTVNSDGYDWYYVKDGSVEGYIRDDLVQTIYADEIGTYYYSYNTGSGSNMVREIYHRYKTKIGGYDSASNFVIGIAPKEMSNVSNSTLYKYYSFDSNYFYTDILLMLDDYKNNTNGNAINKDNPYYSYYMYLPSHSKSGYNAETFDMIVRNAGYTSQPDSTKVYAKNCAWTSESRKGLSKLYGTGVYFIELQNTYGVNSLMAFGKAMSESGTGTSLIAMQKNNLFGIGASDKNPCTNAATYDSPRLSIMAYGTLGNSYVSPSSSVYAGSHYGNKASGMNVKYASDPYWGEKAAMHAYSYDSRYGKLDYDYNTLGIKKSSEVVPILKKPGDATATNTIYYTKNYSNSTYKIENMAFIVLDKVTYNNAEYYKVQTDPALDNNQNMANTNYTFERSYGYIKTSYLNVNNSQPELTVEDKTIKQGDTVDLLKNIKAYDKEDKDITNNITYDDSKVDYYKEGVYEITYSVKDSNNFNKSVVAKITVVKADNPIVTGNDVEIVALKKFDILSGLKIYNDEYLEKVDYIITLNDKEVLLTDMINSPGIYNVSYKAIDKFGNTSNTYNRKITVIANELPVITASDITLKQNSSYDLKSYAKASDKEDGDLTSSIIFDTNLDITTPGTYNVTYKVKDKDNQEVTKTVTITVEEISYTEKDGYLHLESLTYNNNTKTLDIKGFLNVNGIVITKDMFVKYDLLLINEETKKTTIISLDRILANEPFEALNKNKSWFTGKINLKDIEKGNYKIYVRARVNTFETKKVLKNVFFLNNIPSRFESDGRGYTLRTDYSSKEMPLELTVRDNELITNYNTSILYNMYNQYYKIEFSGFNLKIKGTSHSYKGNYSLKSNVERQIIFENINTFAKKEFDLGYITNGDYKVSLAVSDGFDKTKAWYDKTIDISSLEPGRYAIIIRTKTDNIDDYGELYDYMWSNINFTTTYDNNGKKYNAKIVRNNSIRMRLELIIEEA